MQSRLEKLVAMSTEDLYDHMVWIDWRSEEREVIEGFSEQLSSEDQLSCNDSDNPTTIFYRGQTYPNPLTSTPADRYVTIFSVAEIIKPDYHIYTETESCDGDTHGFFIFTDTELRELKTTYSVWSKKRLVPLTLGIDGFSGFNVPYYGNESSGDPGLAEKFAKADAAIMKRHQRIMERLSGKKPFFEILVTLG